MAGRVLCEKEGRIGWIVFDHPEKRNAISSHMWAELAEGVRALGADREVRVVVMRGAGEEAFVSGADISQFAAAPGGDTSSELKRGGGNAFAELEQFEKPLIAMIHGFCYGGGVAVSLGADMRYAAEGASFSIPAARLGVGYDLGGIEELARLVGISFAKEILFSARRYDAQEALAIGLVNRVMPAPELEPFTREMAERIADNAPLTVRSVKLITRELRRERAARDMQAVKQALADCFESEDFGEGVRAFMQKRRPRFRGR